ncbi:MAG: hypothetical protein R3C30_11750 [Hyphomonadaceae bacterium]
MRFKVGTTINSKIKTNTDAEAVTCELIHSLAAERTSFGMKTFNTKNPAAQFPTIWATRLTRYACHVRMRHPILAENDSSTSPLHQRPLRAKSGNMRIGARSIPQLLLRAPKKIRL